MQMLAKMVELKYNMPIGSAIAQIKEKRYTGAIKCIPARLKIWCGQIKKRIFPK